MKYLILILSFFNLSEQEHPIYISNTEIHYRAEDRKLEIAMCVFASDLEDVLSKKLKKEIEIGTDLEKENLDALLEAYIRENFSLEIDGRHRDLSFLGRELDKSDLFKVWFFFEIDAVYDFSEVHVRNSILHDLLDSQDNIVLLNKSGVIKRLSLQKHQNEGVFEF